MNPPTPNIRIAALYRFCRLENPAGLREPLTALCRRLGVKGTLLLAREGVNGTVAGSAAAIAELVDYIKSFPEMAGLEVKYSSAAEMPFHRLKVRLKREIVTMGKEDVDPLQGVGAYVEPRDWNALISTPGTVVIDTRNDYEVSLGSFKGAIDPETSSFREFPDWVLERRETFQGKKIALFCTGGIRCEKATAFAKSLGLNDVFHLKGGILRYLEEVPAEESLWQGECFVFDERVSVSHGLEVGEAALCRACRRPLTPQDRLSPKFREGVSCDRCFDRSSNEDKERFAERQRQVELAQTRGGSKHIGS